MKNSIFTKDFIIYWILIFLYGLNVMLMAFFVHYIFDFIHVFLLWNLCDIYLKHRKDD